jgi:oligosaccharyltransferase complex subunit beta
MVRARATATAAAGALLLLALAAPAAAAEGRVLVLLDDLAMQRSHARFLGGLRARGYALDVAAVDGRSLKLKELDTFLYDKLVILGGARKLGEGARAPAVLEFFDAGRDVFLALGPDAAAPLRGLAADLGAEPTPPGALVVDHLRFHPELGGDDHATILAPGPAALPAVFAATTKGPILYRGAGLRIAPGSETAVAALAAPPTAYAAAPGGAPAAAGAAPAAGAALALAALVTGRTSGSRAALLGSTDALSDAAFAAAPGNAGFAADLAAWAFRARGVLRASPLRHRVAGGPWDPAEYRVGDAVEAAIDVERCDDGRCGPYAADDLQVEFTMLDPHVRAAMRPAGNGTFIASFRAPDVYGVFKWVVDYRRQGLSWVQASAVVPVRPFRHDEYERFIGAAAPYYAAVAATMAGFAATGAFFLYSQ